MGAQSTRRARAADDPRLDHDMATPILKQSGRGKACRAAPPEPGSTGGAAARETDRLLRGLKRLHQEGFGARRTRRTNAAQPDANIIVPRHCFRKKVSKDECSLSIAGNGTLPALLAMFEGSLKSHSSFTQPTGRTLRLLSCRLNRSTSLRSLSHSLFLSWLRQGPRMRAATRRSSLQLSPGAPCSLPRSATAV